MLVACCLTLPEPELLLGGLFGRLAAFNSLAWHNVFGSAAV